MLDAYLVHENTTATAKGDGEAIDVSASAHRVFLLVLRIAEIVEQESIDVSVLGSADGTGWEPKPLLRFPQEFYRGEAPMLLDLRTQPQLKFLRAHWEVNRWGRGPEEPMFIFDVRVKEVPAALLAEAQKEAKNLRS
jgi:hypothetical protein